MPPAPLPPFLLSRRNDQLITAFLNQLADNQILIANCQLMLNLVGTDTLKQAFNLRQLSLSLDQDLAIRRPACGSRVAQKYTKA